MIAKNAEQYRQRGLVSVDVCSHECERFRRDQVDRLGRIVAQRVLMILIVHVVGVRMRNVSWIIVVSEDQSGDTVTGQIDPFFLFPSCQ